MKAIILSGGLGTRLYPATKKISKQLLPIFDKPMIYYSLSLIISAGIKSILIISNPEFINIYKKIIGNGKDLGIKIEYSIQKKPRGIVESLIIGKKFISKDDFCLLLGDNFFYGNDVLKKIQFAKANLKQNFSSIFAYEVSNPNDYGVIKFKNDVPIKIVEKPKKYVSNYSVPGLYFYKNNVINLLRYVKPSKRGELEITDLNNLCFKNNLLKVINFDETTIWMDMGSPNRLLEASAFVHSIEQRKNIKIGCIEEISYITDNISLKDFRILINKLPNSNYKNYLILKYENNKNFSE